jgi:hypothetical protein
VEREEVFPSGFIEMSEPERSLTDWLSETPDMSAILDSVEELLAEDLNLSVDQARRVLEWQNSRHHDLRVAGEELHQILVWLTAPANRNSGEIAGVWGAMDASQESADRICKRFAVRVLALIWMVAPELLGGISQVEIARRIKCTRALVSFYCTSFSRRFSYLGRGCKSLAARSTFAAVQKGNQNRIKAKQANQTANQTIIKNP